MLAEPEAGLLRDRSLREATSEAAAGEVSPDVGFLRDAGVHRERREGRHREMAK